MSNSNPSHKAIKLLDDLPYDAFKINQLSQHHELPSLSWPSLTSFADTLMAKVMPTMTCDTPLLISGDWGAGKTSVLKYVENRLDCMDSALSTTVWFDAWFYEKEPSLLQALIRVLWLEYQKKNSNVSKEIKELCEKTLRLAAVISVRFLAGLSYMRSGPANFEKDLSTLEQNIPLENHTDKMVQLLEDLINDMWGANSEITIFVDDLDRCSPLSAVELLESIRIILNSTHKLKCKFVVIMDKSTLADAVKKKYSAMSSYDANRYLEKMFPYTFNVPHPDASEVALLIDKLVGQFKENNKDNGFELETIEKHIFIAILSKPEYANPRLIKRCINRFAFFKSVVGKPIDEDAEDLILWLAAIERWPVLRRLLMRKSENFWLEFYRQLKTNEVIREPDAKDLATQPGIREFFAGFDKADILLRMKRLKQVDKELSRYGL